MEEHDGITGIVARAFVRFLICASLVAFIQPGLVPLVPSVLVVELLVREKIRKRNNPLLRLRKQQVVDEELARILGHG